MKQFEGSANDVREMVARLRDKERRNELLFKLAVLGGILVLVCMAVMAVRHLLKSKAAEDDDWDMDLDVDYGCDENGCYYAADDDFEIEG